MKKQLYHLFPFIPKINLFIGQALYLLIVKLNRQNVINKLSSSNNIYANIGCGGLGLKDGWVNIDLGKASERDLCI